MDRKFLLFILISPLLLTSALTYRSSMLVKAGHIPMIGIGIYWDFNCSDPVLYIDWGTSSPRDACNIIVYIKNGGDVNVTLSLNTTNWLPSSAEHHFSLVWNYHRETLVPGQVINTTFTLSVSSVIEEIYYFSFDAVIAVEDGVTVYHTTPSFGSIFYFKVHNLDTGLNYSTIQQAIDADETLNEHTIFVEEGIHCEHILVNKTISLLGEDRDYTIIDGNGTGTGVEVTANNVTVSNFTIRNCVYQGLYVNNSSDNRITNNNIHSTVGTIGSNIFLWWSDNNIITNNDISNCTEVGIMIAWSNNSFFAGNNIYCNSYCGITLFYFSCNNTFVGNNMSSNGPRAELPDKMIWVGIEIGGDSNNNRFFHNNFINNSADAWSKNVWDSGYPSGGNYWSDYNGTDFNSGPAQNVAGGDGIGDTAHSIETDNVDRFPLMAPIDIFDVGTWNDTPCEVHVISNSTVSNLQLNETAKMISFNVTDETGSGFCRVTIPNIIIQNMWGGNYTVLVDGEKPLDIRNWTDTTNTYIYFTYQHSEHEIIITSEFPLILLLPLFMIATLLIAVILKKGKMRHNNENCV